jgi:protocatechuate 3,4-dioxygenase beta subunit
VRGRITAAATSQPLHRVRVTLNGPAQNPPTGVTDAEGRFEITTVPAGSYSVTASRAGYLTIQYGQRRPREAGRTLEIKEGEIVERIDIALFRGAVLAGRITDELGEPVAGVRLEAMDFRYVRGRRMLIQAGIATSNDIGQFRISGMEPGTYHLRASTTEMWTGDNDSNETFAYAQTYYPGVSTSDNAQSVTLAVGQEVSSLDFPLSVGRAVKVSGVVTDAGGNPLASQRVSLERVTRTVGGALFSSGGPGGGAATSGPDGSFEVRNLSPGEYMLTSGNFQAENVRMSIIVADADVTNLQLTPRRGGIVSGQIVTDEATPPPFATSSIRLTPIRTDLALQIPGGSGEQVVRPDWSFRIANIDGPHLIRAATLPSEWMLKAVLLGDKDVTDSPLDIQRGPVETDGFRLVLSRRGAVVSGNVVDGGDRPLADSTVIVFAADPARWGSATRFVRAARPGRDGRFAIGGLPPGAYRAVARDFVVEGQWEDPTFLDSLANEATRIELAEGETKRLTLKVEPKP